MSGRTVAALTARLLALIVLLMCVPAALALHDGDWRAVFAFGVSAGVVAAFVAALAWLGRGASPDLHRKDALGAVSLTWLLLGLLGALPFLLEGSIPSLDSAVFEAVSGFTTTGATVIGNIDGLSRATNLYRCLTHWVGGMGIVVLFVAVFPQLGVGAKHLFKTEVPGPITEGLRPRIKQTALALWWVYAGLTAVAATLLVLVGMPLYDAVCHAFSTLGTGGFSTKGASVGAYHNAAVDWIVIAFMLIAGLNFGLYYAVLRGDVQALWTNYEVRFYLGFNLLAIGIVFLCIHPVHPDAVTALRYAAFQTAAVTTTTGFMTEDFDAYPDVARMLLFLAMFMGGCAGSTAGGLKASRVYALFKLTRRELVSVLQPQAVVPVRLGDRAIPPAVSHGILVFVAAYILLFAFASLAMVASGLDILSAMSSVVACLSSIGPGLSKVGPTQTFDFIHPAGKVLLCLCMVAGRLEIFALLAIFTPSVWRK